MRFLRQLERMGVEVHVAELAYDEQPHFLPESPRFHRFRTSPNNVFWHKENLLNLAAERLPEHCDSVAWIDADLWFTNREWPALTSDRLERHAVVQLFEYAQWAGRDGRASGGVRGSAADQCVKIGRNHPGFAWAARREFWRSYGGLCENAIAGSGDTVMASAWLGEKELPREVPYRNEDWRLWTEKSRAWVRANGGCGFVPGTVVHDWHGDHHERRYTARFRLLEEIDPKNAVSRREDGLLEFTPDVPINVRLGFKAYFDVRNEDGDAAIEPSPPRSHNSPGAPRLRTRTEIINWLITRQGYTSYLEIGVGDGAHFRNVLCLDKESVDPAVGEYASANPTHRMTSDEFFSQNARTFDLIFIDGLHHAEVVYRDLCSSLRVLRPNGTIVCHDLNPETEEMQRVPRETKDWTGDGWKAWVRLRTERPELAMVVSETDRGVGIIHPGANWRGTEISPKAIPLDWERFAVHRRQWLNLVAPARLPNALFPWWRAAGATRTLSIVTLWRGNWTAAQANLLNWYLHEQIPEGTCIVWMAPEGSEAESALESGGAKISETPDGVTVELLMTPEIKVTDQRMKHHAVAALYNDALRNLDSDIVLLVEDDIEPGEGALGTLLTAFRQLPAEAGSLMALYRSRVRPDSACAGHWYGNYLGWPDEAESGLIEIGWGGGGFTLYRGECLHRYAPLYAETRHSIRGWDVTLSERMRADGSRLFAHGGVRVIHQWT